MCLRGPNDLLPFNELSALPVVKDDSVGSIAVHFYHLSFNTQDMYEICMGEKRQPYMRITIREVNVILDKQKGMYTYNTGS